MLLSQHSADGLTLCRSQHNWLGIVNKAWNNQLGGHRQNLEYVREFRTGYNTFWELTRLLGPCRQDTRFCPAISDPHRVAIALWRVAHDASYNMITSHLGIGTRESTARYICEEVLPFSFVCRIWKLEWLMVLVTTVEPYQEPFDRKRRDDNGDISSFPVEGFLIRFKRIYQNHELGLTDSATFVRTLSERKLKRKGRLLILLLTSGHVDTAM